MTMTIEDRRRQIWADPEQVGDVESTMAVIRDYLTRVNAELDRLEAQLSEKP